MLQRRVVFVQQELSALLGWNQEADPAIEERSMLWPSESLGCFHDSDFCVLNQLIKGVCEQ